MVTGSKTNVDAAERGAPASEGTRAEEMSTASYNPHWYDPRWCLHDPKTGTIFFGIFFAIADGFLILLYVKWAKNFGKANMSPVLAMQTDAAAAIAAVYGVWFLLDCMLVTMALRKAGLPGCQAWLLATSLRYLHVAVDPTLMVYTCFHLPDCGMRVLPSVLSLLVTVPLPLAQMVVMKYVREMREAMLRNVQVKHLEHILPWMSTEADADAEPTTDAVAEAALSRLHPISEGRKLFPERPTASQSAQPRRKGDLAPLAQQEMMTLVQNLQKSIRWPNPSVVARMAAFAASDEATRKRAPQAEGGAGLSRSAPGRVPGSRRRPRSMTPSGQRKKSSEKKSSGKKSSGKKSPARSASVRRSAGGGGAGRRRSHSRGSGAADDDGREASGEGRKSAKRVDAQKESALANRERGGDVPRSGTRDERREPSAADERERRRRSSRYGDGGASYDPTVSPEPSEERERRKSSKYGDSRASKDSTLSQERVEERERRKSSRYGDSRASKDSALNQEQVEDRERRKSSKYGDSWVSPDPIISLERSEETERRKSSKYDDGRASKDYTMIQEQVESKEHRKSSKYGDSRTTKDPRMSQDHLEDREHRKSSKYGDIRGSKDPRVNRDQVEDRDRRKSSKYGESRASKDSALSQEQIEGRARRKSSEVEESRESRELQRPRRSRDLRRSREQVAEPKPSRHSTPSVR